MFKNVVGTTGHKVREIKIAAFGGAVFRAV
jgi:hypothetical protein